MSNPVLFSSSTPPLKSSLLNAASSIFEAIDQVTTQTSTIDTRIALAISKLEQSFQETTKQQANTIKNLETKLTEALGRLKETESTTIDNRSRILQLETQLQLVEKTAQEQLIQAQNEKKENEEAKKAEPIIKPVVRQGGITVENLIEDAESSLFAAQSLSKSMRDDLSDWDATLNYQEKENQKEQIDQKDQTKQTKQTKQIKQKEQEAYDEQVLNRYLEMSCKLRDYFSPKLSEYGFLIADAERKVQRAIVMNRKDPDQLHHNMESVNKELVEDAKQRKTLLERVESMSTRLNTMFRKYHENTLNQLRIQMENKSNANLILASKAAEAAVAAAAKTTALASSRQQQKRHHSSSSEESSDEEWEASDFEDDHQDIQHQQEDEEEKDEEEKNEEENENENENENEYQEESTEGKESTSLVNQKNNRGSKKKQQTQRANSSGNSVKTSTSPTSKKSSKSKSKSKSKKQQKLQKQQQQQRDMILKKVEKSFNTMRQHLDTSHTTLAETIEGLRQSTVSINDNIQGICNRIKDIELKQEILDNAKEAALFERNSMKLWKQDVQDDIISIKKLIPDATPEYDDTEIQEKLTKLATNAMSTLISIREVAGNSGTQDIKVKAALEEQASAIAHIISSKADRSMVTEQLEGKAGIALEESIRIFMQQVANDIDTRDYRSGKIASCERAALETRMLRLVTSSLRRLRRQQTMLAQALPRGTGAAMMGVIYKCLACDQAQPDILDRDTQKGLEYLRNSTSNTSSNHSGRGRPSTAPHHHVDFKDIGAQARRNVHTKSPYKVKGAGFRVSASASR